jgi:hypothetical protein
MSAEEIQQLRKEIEQLEDDVRRLHEILREVNMAFKGSSTMDSIGIFDRLKAAERTARECDEKVHLRIDHLEKITIVNLEKSLEERFLRQSRDFDYKLEIMFQRIEKNTTLFTAHLIEVETFKKRIGMVTGFVRNLFASKNFWKLLVTAIGLITLDNSKEWGIWDLIDRLIKSVFG